MIITHFSREKLDYLAREKQFVQRQSRLDATRFLDLVLFCDQHLEQVSLEDLANSFNEQHDVSISKQAIQERFNSRAVDFMSALLKELLDAQLSSSLQQLTSFEKFKRVLIKDSTRYTLPAAYKQVFKGHGGHGSPAQISIQYEYDLRTNTTHTLELTSACRNDQQDARETLAAVEEGDLLIRDLGYTTQDYLTYVAHKKAYFVSRLNPRWSVKAKGGKAIDFKKILKKIKKYSLPYLEIEVEIASLPMRLIVSRVPEHVYQKRILKAERSAHGRHKVSDQYKLKAQLNMFITNVTKKWLSTVEVQKIYRLRWQVELIFKTWKSQAGIDKMKPMKLERFQCQLIARLIWLLLHSQAFRCIQQWVLHRGLPIKCSYAKFFKTAFRISHCLKKALFECQPVSQWLTKLAYQAEKKYATETRKGSQNVHKTIFSCLT
jgi:hypothetical protein